jgi:inner membrane transporter RhtA
MNLLFYLALARIPLGLAVTLEFVGPLSLALLASRKTVDFLWAILAGIGIILILPIAPTSETVDPVGVFYALAAGAAWAFYILQGKKAGVLSHPGMITSIGMVMAFLVVAPFGVVHSGATLFNWQILPLGFAVAVLSSAIPYSLEIVAMKNISTRNFGVLMSLEPAVAAAMGLLLLGEQLAFLQWFAIACIITASLGSSFSARKELIVPGYT